MMAAGSFVDPVSYRLDPSSFLLPCYGSRSMATTRPVSDHFDGKEFHNLDGAPTGGSLRDVLRWKLLGGPIPPWPKHTEADVVTPSLPENVEPGKVAATFVGHSTFLLQFAGGLNALTDPVWSERVSPVKFAGPRRVRRPAVRFEDLPPIQLVLVSHGHYDHMDLATLRRLDQTFAPEFVTGLGNREFLQGKGLRRVVELDWWDGHVTEQASGGQEWKVTFSPAQHWSNRSLTKRNTTLWGGFWLQPLQGGGPRVYFAADSGLGRNFAMVRERLGAPDLALLPIGAYEPRWFMEPQHMNPADAVKAHLALEAKQSAGMHFGTFRLTDEGIDEPAKKLAKILQIQRIEARQFLVPKFGETLWAGHSVPGSRVVHGPAVTGDAGDANP